MHTAAPHTSLPALIPPPPCRPTCGSRLSPRETNRSSTARLKRSCGEGGRKGLRAPRRGQSSMAGGWAGWGNAHELRPSAQRQPPRRSLSATQPPSPCLPPPPAPQPRGLLCGGVRVLPAWPQGYAPREPPPPPHQVLQLLLPRRDVLLHHLLRGQRLHVLAPRDALRAKGGEREGEEGGSSMVRRHAPRRPRACDSVHDSVHVYARVRVCPPPSPLPPLHPRTLSSMPSSACWNWRSPRRCTMRGGSTGMSTASATACMVVWGVGLAVGWVGVALSIPALPTHPLTLTTASSRAPSSAAIRFSAVCPISAVRMSSAVAQPLAAWCSLT
jgi:hypothetical protein